MPRAAKTTPAPAEKSTEGSEFAQFIAGLAELLSQFTTGPVAATPKKGTKAAAPVEPEEEDEDESDEEGEVDYDERKAELESMPLAKLRRLVKETEAYEDEDVDKANKASLVKNMLDFEYEDEDAEDSDEDEDEEDEEGDEDEEGYDRDALQAMTLPQVKKIAREEFEIGVGDLRGLDKDSVIDLIMEAQEGDEDEDEDEDAEDEYTRDELEAMSDAQLKALLKEYGKKPARGSTREDWIDTLMEIDEDEEE